MTAATVMRHVTNLFYPLHCPGCAKPLDPAGEAVVCGACAAQVRRNPAPDRPSCDSSIRAWSVCVYDGVLKELIHTLKYGRKRSLAPFFAGIMGDFIRENGRIAEDADLVTWIPLEAKRLRGRTFNQAELIAREIGRGLSLPAEETLIKRKATKHQNELSRDERLLNMRDAFAARPAAVRGRTVIVVDDVMTTGATLAEAARALKAAGARDVRGLTLARGL